MIITLPMTTQEAIRTFIADAAWGTVEELAEVLDIMLEARRDDDDDVDPEIGEDDLESIRKGLTTVLRLDAAATPRIEAATLPGMVSMKGATMPEPRMRALEALGIDPLALLMVASLIMDFEITIEGGEFDGTAVEANVLETGTFDEPGGRVVPVITTRSMHWGEEVLVVYDRQMPNVMMPRYEGGPLDELVDHPLTRGRGLVIDELTQDGPHLSIWMKAEDWATVEREDRHATLA